jgi:peroxiredoxin
MSLVGDFALPDLAGRTIRLSDFAGQVVLMAFWSTGCEPCLRELPVLQNLWDRHRQAGLQLISINVDGPELLHSVRRAARRYRLRFPVLLDRDSEVVALYNPHLSLPFTVVVDRQGRLVSTHRGYRIGDELGIEALVVRLIGDG